MSQLFISKFASVWSEVWQIFDQIISHGNSSILLLSSCKTEVLSFQLLSSIREYEGSRQSQSLSCLNESDRPSLNMPWWQLRVSKNLIIKSLGPLSFSTDSECKTSNSDKEFEDNTSLINTTGKWQDLIIEMKILMI